MAARKKKRTPAQERATKRMIAARKKQLRAKKKPAKKKTAKKKTARKKTTVRRVRRNPAKRPAARGTHYLLEARTATGKKAGYWDGMGFSGIRADAVLVRHKSQAEAIARKLANRSGKSIAVLSNG